MNDISEVLAKSFAILIVCLLLILLLISMKMLAADTRNRESRRYWWFYWRLLHSPLGSCSGSYSVRTPSKSSGVSFNCKIIACSKLFVRMFQSNDEAYDLSSKASAGLVLCDVSLGVEFLRN